MKGHNIDLDLLDACQCEHCKKLRNEENKQKADQQRRKKPPLFPEPKKIRKYLQPKKKRFYASAILLMLSILVSLTVMIPTTTANLYYPDLKGSSITETARNVDNWLTYAPNPKGAGIVYTLSDFPHEPMETLMTKKGDCTDIALVGVMLLREYGIQTRLVTGYARGGANNESGYHDWYEYRNESGEWTTFESKYFDKLTVYEYGKLG